MFNIGPMELILILTLALVLFGPKKLPELGKSLGKGIREFKKATDELKTSWEDQVKDIQSPLNDVKKDIHSIGQGLKDDFYKSVDSEQIQPSAPPALESHEAHTAPNPTESTEAAAPEEHA